jgi:hypothetical protein
VHAWNAINLWDTTGKGSEVRTIIIGNHWYVACVQIGRNNTVDAATPHVPLLSHSNLKVTKIDLIKGTNQQFLSRWGQNISTAPGIVVVSIIPFALQVKEKYPGINRINSRLVPDEFALFIDSTNDEDVLWNMHASGCKAHLAAGNC